MFFTIDKESLLNKLKIVEKVTAQRGNVQPVLANVLKWLRENKSKDAILTLII